MRLLFAKGGFAQVVAADSPGVADSILFDLNHAIEVLGGMDKPFAEVAADETLRAKLEALRVVAEECGPDRRRHHRAERRAQLRLQRHGWRLVRWRSTAARF